MSVEFIVVLLLVVLAALFLLRQAVRKWSALHKLAQGQQASCSGCGCSSRKDANGSSSSGRSDEAQTQKS